MPAGNWWFMCINLATQEAEMRRIMVPGQPRQIVCKILSQTKISN
jgi:3-hydroxymyristoyl/3-hydroxydecanoyl-(acyl carrier protein) dehydratase